MSRGRLVVSSDVAGTQPIGGVDRVDAPTTTPSGTPLQEKPSPIGAPRSARLLLLLDLVTWLLRLLELGAVFASGLWAAYLLPDLIPPSRQEDYVRAVLLGAIFFAGLAEATGAYDADARFSLRKGGGRVLTSWMATGLFMVTLGFLIKASEDFSRSWAVIWLLAGGAGLLVARGLGTIWMRQLKRRGVFNQRVAIFGAGAQGDRLARYVLGNDRLTIDLVGFFDDRPDGRLPKREAALPMVGKLSDLIALIRAGEIDQVIIALPWSAEARLQEVVGLLAMTPVRIRLAPDLASFAFAQRQVVLLGELPVMTLFERPISGFDQVIKFIEDRILAVLCLILVSPVLALAALAIRLDSPGPIFFRQDREGFNNRPFRIWKFRSMHTDQCEVDGITQARKGDARITRVGTFMRRTSIDELPQLFNVMTGEMSLVGPRPHAPSTRAGEKLFGDVVATYAARHKVKPGITGWAQVNGWRGETDTEEKLVKRLEHDLFYIENWSLFFDLYILIRTLASVLFHRRAY
jgi:Undecaprenyl-phosphate glucose phosphotransferase